MLRASGLILGHTNNFILKAQISDNNQVCDSIQTGITYHLGGNFLKTVYEFTNILQFLMNLKFLSCFCPYPFLTLCNLPQLSSWSYISVHMCIGTGSNSQLGAERCFRLLSWSKGPHPLWEIFENLSVCRCNLVQHILQIPCTCLEKIDFLCCNLQRSPPPTPDQNPPNFLVGEFLLLPPPNSQI